MGAVGQMNTDERGLHRGDAPVVLDGVTYYPFPDGDDNSGTCHECCARIGALGTCFRLLRGCLEYDYHWRTGFEAVVLWTARAEKEKS